MSDHVFRSRNYVNLVVIDKQPQLQWLTIDEAEEHCAKGAGIWTGLPAPTTAAGIPTSCWRARATW